MVSRPFGTLVARGNTSDVYAWGRDAIVKVLRPGIPPDWADQEARNTRLVRDAGLPVPEVLDVTTVDGHAAIVFTTIHGPSMWDRMLADPADISRLSVALVDLQAQVNSVSSPGPLPGLTHRLRAQIDQVRALTRQERALAHHALDRREDGADSLCHFDVHPNNVLMTDGGPVLVDWFDAAGGSPTADVVRTSVLMRSHAATGHLACSDPAIICAAHDAYIAAVLGSRRIDWTALPDWERVILTARLAEPLDGATQRATLDALRSTGASRFAGRSQPQLMALTSSRRSS